MLEINSEFVENCVAQSVCLLGPKGSVGDK
jgi:hypothetical protein